MKSLYNRFVDTTARKPSGRLGKNCYRDPKSHYESFRMALERLQLQPHDDYLELGCGGGVLLEHALQCVRSAVGLDHSADMLALSAQRNAAALAAGRLVLAQGDAQVLPWRAGAFSCVAATSMFFFLARPDDCLQEVRRVLRPAGRLIIVTAADSRLFKLAMLPWSSATRTYPRATMEAMLRAAGFGMVEVTEPGGIYQVAYAVA
jgi:ubiquinone/menaquinone biosynthesis C-methylase UbiE